MCKSTKKAKTKRQSLLINVKRGSFAQGLISGLREDNSAQYLQQINFSGAKAFPFQQTETDQIIKKTQEHVSI